MAANDLEGPILAEVKREKMFELKPRLNYKATITSMPPTIDPNNWKPISASEQIAHQERQEIRGRLRREFWKKLYDPVLGKHFNSTNTDKQAVNWYRARTVWHIRSTFQPTGKGGLSAMFVGLGLPIILLWVSHNYDPMRAGKFDSIIKS